MKGKKKLFNLYDELSELSDIRRCQGKRHKIELTVMIVVLGIMNGYDGYRAIGDFTERNRSNLLATFKPNKNRLPSIWTIRRVLNKIDFNELCLIFNKWTKCNIDIQEKEWISLDGKAIKGTYPEDKHKFINLVSVFCPRNKLVCSMGKVDKKSNEIPKVKTLIDNFPAKKVIYRMDALHCQKKTIKAILKKDSFYVLEVKNNQKKLLKKIKFITKYLLVESSDITKNMNRGRLEMREVTTYIESLDLKHYGWDHLKLIIKVKRTVHHKSGKISKEKAYFITNLDEEASFFNRGIRNHWKIENSLHYVKDVTFNEDRLKIRTENAPQNISLLRSLVINVFRTNGFKNIKQATRLLVGRIGTMVAMVM